ncbi:SCO family protein [Arenicella xantha]|uniref:Cytochrome oxidase Cu insertion factor (SCO1/SenC/PrrC family) n=1 Tax=Arenicella xantha TaxID=644221 RepID=A0A395JI13_9GAMM|nr:SCO family protein [Arenicella xantha]RBP49219.1 cytochrome oxidase Cu insertion factor (SCO1/SenC/PrrC family) [Arenicella xantha]
MKYQLGKVNPVFILVALLAIGIGVYIQLGSQSAPPQPEFKKLILLPTPRDLAPVTFTDHRGDTVNVDQFQGHWSIIFFGFTHCPDVCPTTMQTLKQVKQRVSEAGFWSNNKVIMVTVDPERDSVERLANYVPFFDNEFVGLRANVSDTTEFAKQVGVLFFKDKAADNGAYDVDHSAALILINPQGQYAGVITAPHKADEITADLIDLAKYQGINQATSNTSTTQATSALTENTTPSNTSALLFSDAWIRPAPPTATSMAAYFIVQNTSTKTISLTAVSSPDFAMSMMHESIMQNDVMSMEHLATLELAPGESASFEPMGKHVMLMKPKKSLLEGQSTKIVFSTADGQQITVDVPIKQPKQ